MSINTETVLSEDASLIVHEAFLSKEEADALLAHTATLPLESNPSFMIYGKPATMHRDIGFFTDDPAVEGYRYSRQIARSQPLSPELASLLKKVNDYNGTNFNAILVNRYKNKRDSIGAHSDDESALVAGLVVAVSLGSPRIFRIREKASKARVMDVTTTHGQMLTMSGDQFQKQFTHEVPPALKREPDGVRVSLTFRRHES